MSGFYSTIARFYDAENKGKDDDIELYLEIAQDYEGDILDIGCGTGRVMLPLARAGYTVHGIDNDAAMLEIAERYRTESPDIAHNIILHHGDARNYTLDHKFGMVLVPYNGMMHFHTEEEQLAVLKRLRTWTADNGLLVLDLPNAGEVFATRESDALMLERTFLEPESGHMVMQMSNSYLDRTAKILQINWIYDEITADGTVQRTYAPLRLYYYFYPEIKLLLQLSGFEVTAVYGDTDYNEFVDGCERMIVFARPV